jgi:tyrosine-protein kinase Etk/Wzc
MDYAEAAQRYTPDYQGLDGPVNVGRQRDLVKVRLEQALRATLTGAPSLQGQGELSAKSAAARLAVMQAEAQLNAATVLRDRLRAETGSLPTTSLEYARLARDAQLNRDLYTSLQANLNAARLDRDITSGNVQIAQYAFAPEKPLRPDRKRDLLFGGAVGCLMALGAVLVLEHVDQRVRTLADVRTAVSGPVIGTVPALSRRTLRELLSVPSTAAPSRAAAAALEAYGVARANLGLFTGLEPRGAGAAARPAGQVVLVTSALPGEGKSLTAAMLARTLARAGVRVALVDADLRRPAQNRLFGTAEPVGLADVLAGGVALDDALVGVGLGSALTGGRQRTPAELTVLYSGKPEPGAGAADLLSLPRMRQTLDALRAEADAVIVDAPAAAVVADALLLAPLADHIVYVVGAGRVDVPTVRETAGTLAGAGARTQTDFVNRAPRGGVGDARYYRHYGFRAEDAASRPTLAALPAAGDAGASSGGSEASEA